MKRTLSDAGARENILLRLDRLSPADEGLWGQMSVHQVVCHLQDAYQVALGERFASPAASVMPRALFKRIALYAPVKWPKGVPTLPEVEQGKGGTPPGDFHADRAALIATCERFCAGLPTPLVTHSIFGPMSKEDWMRWGYLHADHHLRQFGR